MIKKFLLAAYIISGVLMASQAFAAAYYEPGQPAAKFMMTTASGTPTSVSNMTYHVMRAAGPFGDRIEMGWLALMFVLTVAMVWVALILLIAVLWHKLCEQRHHHREHHHK